MLYQTILILNFLSLIICFIIFEYRLIKFVQDINYNTLLYRKFFKYFYIKNVYMFLTLLSLFIDNIIVLIINFFVFIFLIIKNIKYKNIIKLRFTKRLIIYLFINLFIILSFYMFIDIYIIFLLIPFIGFSSIYISKVFDYLFNLKYFYKAKKKIDKINPYVISISGSSGKTSVKNIVYDLIKDDYVSYKTKKSFNTLKGIEITINDINDNIYKPYLILEMGAKKRNDIKSICNLVKPDLSILTNILPQHLETFKSIDNVLEEKSNIIWSLKENGICIINDDDHELRKLKERIKLNRKDVKIYSYSIIDKSSFIYAYNIDLCLNKTTFNVCFDNHTYFIESPLIGRHSVYNIMISLIVCFILKINIEKIILKLKFINYIPNRLEIKKRDNILILDDSYNSNINGFINAIDILNMYNGDKYLITPGIVECRSSLENEHIANVLVNCSIFVILIENKNIEIYLKVFKKHDFTFFLIKKSFKEAYNYVLNESISKEICLLIENDLTDDYYL